MSLCPTQETKVTIIMMVLLWCRPPSTPGPIVNGVNGEPNHDVRESWRGEHTWTRLNRDRVFREPLATRGCRMPKCCCLCWNRVRIFP